MSPIFEFQCENGHLHERVLQCGSDEWAREHPCPACGAPTTRIISVPAEPVVRAGTPKHHQRRPV